MRVIRYGVAISAAVIMTMSSITASALFMKSDPVPLAEPPAPYEERNVPPPPPPPPPPPEYTEPAPAAPPGLDFVTEKQGRLLLVAGAATYLAVKVDLVIRDSLEMNTDDDMAAISLLQQTRSKKNMEKAVKLLNHSKIEEKDFDIIIHGTDAQRAKLKHAMEEASRYRAASNILLGISVPLAVQVIQETVDAVKNEDVVTAIVKGRGFISTARTVKWMIGKIKEHHADYNLKANTAKQMLNPMEATTKDKDIQTMADTAQDGGLDS